MTRFHIGGDEVPRDAMTQSKACKALGVAGNVSAMRYHLFSEVSKIALSLGLEHLQVWEDLMFDEAKLPFSKNKFPVQSVTVNTWNNIWEHGHGHRSALFANHDYQVWVYNNYTVNFTVLTQKLFGDFSQGQQKPQRWSQEVIKIHKTD